MKGKTILHGDVSIAGLIYSAENISFDGSINGSNLRDAINNLKQYTDSSLSSLEASMGGSYTSFEYVDGSLAERDGSINLLMSVHEDMREPLGFTTGRDYFVAILEGPTIGYPFY